MAGVYLTCVFFVFVVLGAIALVLTALLYLIFLF